VATQLKPNIHVNRTISEPSFVKMRQTRDATLGMPTLILPALQINMRGGRLLPADDSGQVFLKLPLNAFDGTDISGITS
jgi:hypothetical protein